MSTKHDHTIDELIEMKSGFQRVLRAKTERFHELRSLVQQHTQAMEDFNSRVASGEIDALDDEEHWQALEQVEAHRQDGFELLETLNELCSDITHLAANVRTVDHLIIIRESGVLEGWDDAPAW